MVRCMVDQPGRVWLHIGLHKTGTTYLQVVLRRNSGALSKQGVYLPHGPQGPVFRGVDDLQGRRVDKSSDSRLAGAWPRLVEMVRNSQHGAALISDERLSLSSLSAIEKVRDAFTPAELSVIVTVRDLARVLVSSWEEAVRGSATWTWPEYAAAIFDPGRRGLNPARNFWVRQDVGQVCGAWESVVPAGRIHIVTVPPPGAERDVLVRRFCSAFGVDASSFAAPRRTRNESTGVAGTELIRLVNAKVADRLDPRQHDAVTKRLLAPPLALTAERTAPGEAELVWARGRAAEDIARLRQRGYSVHGDLDDLVPRDSVGRVPGSATEHELLDAALEALTFAAVQFGKSPAAAAAPHAESAAFSPPAMRSLLRGAVFRTSRVAVNAGDRRRFLNPVISAAFRAREARQARAQARAQKARETAERSNG